MTEQPKQIDLVLGDLLAHLNLTLVLIEDLTS